MGALEGGSKENGQATTYVFNDDIWNSIKELG